MALINKAFCQGLQISLVFSQMGYGIEAFIQIANGVAQFMNRFEFFI